MSMIATFKRLLLYILTGGTAAIVDIGGFGLLCAGNMPVVLAAAFSFCTSAIVNFVLTARYVFKATATPQRFAVFFPAALVGLVINVLVTTICATYFSLPRLLAKTIAIGITFLLSFSINEYFVFRYEWPRRRRKAP